MENKANILFVDDEPGFLKAMVDVLTRRDYVVKTAKTSASALELLRKEDFDLLVTDINMPDMDGIELIRQVQRFNPQQRVVIVTGFPSHESQEKAFRLGIINYLVKPFAVGRLLEVIANALQVDVDKKTGIIGPVELTCEDLIQMQALDRRSIVLEIRNHKDLGKIFFEHGKVIHAETKKRKGKGAFYEIQSWKTGIFKTAPLESDVEHTIDQSVEVLLLEGATLQDEENRNNHESSGELYEKGKESNSNNERRQSMPSMIEEINSALKDLADNTPGLSLSLFVDNEGLPVARYSSIQLPEGTAEKVSVASLALLGLARRNTDQLGLRGFQEVLIKADTGYVYSVSVGGPAGYVLVARTDQNIALGALFMTVRSARDRINKAMGVV